MRVRYLWFVGLVSWGCSVAGCTSAATKQAVRYYERGDYQAAAAAAERGIAADADDDGAWRMRVRAALALGDSAAIADSYARYRKARGGDDLELATELAQSTLAQALTSPSTALRIAAIRAVEESELFALADAVAACMADRDDRVVATAAAAVLRGYNDAATALDDMLRSEDAEARRIAVDGLGRKVAKLAIAELTTAAADVEAAVRRTALQHLARLRDLELAPVFRAHLGDVDDGVRAAAVRGLAELGPRSTASTAEVMAALRDRALGVRLAGVALAAAVGARDTLRPLLADADPTVALEAATALHLGAAELAPLIARALASSDWTTKVTALNQLVTALGPTVAAAKARGLGNDPEVAVRLAAARVLGHAGAKAEAKVIFAAVLDATGGTAERAIEAAVDLVQLGEARGEDSLSRTVGHADAAEVRAQAAAAHRLARKITPGLLAALADSAGAVRVAAAAALAAVAKAAAE